MKRVIKKAYYKLYKGIFGLKKYLIKRGVNIGKNCFIYSDISTTESYLITLGDNVTVSGNVTFVTHDNAICKALPDKSDIFGRINIGDNCFIGIGATVMYGVSIAANNIVAAGAVVTKSVVTTGNVIAGNPARIIGTVEEFKKKAEKYAVNIEGLKRKDKKAVILNAELYERKAMDGGAELKQK